MKIKLPTNTKTHKWLKKLTELKNEKVEIGHFAESGEHYSGMSFPDLMRLHHVGVRENNIPPRPVLDILVANNPKITNHKEVARALKKLTRADLTTEHLEKFLQEVGQAMAEEEADIFGSNMLTKNKEWYARLKGEDAPLVLTEELVNEVSYKDSISKRRKKWR